MRLDARTKLTFLQERLRSLRERLPRDHYHYGVIQVEGNVPMSWHEEPPFFYPFTYYSASFSRSYKDASGSRKYTKNFDSEDLGSVMALAQQASELVAHCGEVEKAPAKTKKKEN